MRKLLLFFTCIFLIYTSRGQGICNEGGSILLYSNYDGGTLNINIDENIPDIRIGLCSYESITVNITGTYADNVSSVVYAGYDDDGTTSVSGVDAAIVDIRLYPAVTMDDPDGYGFMICAYDCDTDFVPGGCNTVDQLTDYFLEEWPDADLRFSQLQYGTWGGSTFTMSSGGNCCLGAETSCFIDIELGKDAIICAGESETLVAMGATTYSWTPSDGIDCVAPCATVTASPEVTTEYIVTGTDADGCFGTDTIIVYVNPVPDALLTVAGDTLSTSGGVSYIWLLDGEVIPGASGPIYIAGETGNYSVIVTTAQGCSDTSALATVIVEVPQSIVHQNDNLIRVYPIPATEVLIVEWASAIPATQVQLFNLSGSLCYDAYPTAGAKIPIPVGQLENGTYLLLIHCSNGTVIRYPVVLQH